MEVVKKVKKIQNAFKNLKNFLKKKCITKHTQKKESKKPGRKVSEVNNKRKPKEVKEKMLCKKNFINLFKYGWCQKKKN